jgi:two-component system response regulator DesR
MPGVVQDGEATQGDRLLRIVCVDDNPAITTALKGLLGPHKGFEWKGSLASADDLVEFCADAQPDLVLIDVDMPGKSPFEALTELAARCPGTRGVMFTGYVHRELVEKSLDAGAWGYVSKNDGEEELLLALQRAASGELALSPEAKAVYGR